MGGWADAVWLQGKRFGTIGARKDGRRIEITTHRAEAYHPDSRKPDVVFGDSIEVDLSRRDFTVNAMALRLPDLELIDPYDGLDRPRRRPAADPARSRGLVLRRPAADAAGGAVHRRASGLEPDEALVDAVRALHDRLAIVSAERIRDELDKLLVVDAPRRGCGSWSRPGWRASSCPSCPAWPSNRTPIHRHKDVLAHTLAVVDKTQPERLLRLAAPCCTTSESRGPGDFGPGGVTFHHHEVVGARMARDRMTALRYPKDDIDTVTRLVELHLRFHTYRLGWTDRAVRRYVRDAGPLLEQLNELTRCDCTTRNAAKARVAAANAWTSSSAASWSCGPRRSSTPSGPSSTAARSWTTSACRPGPSVGQALDFLLELRLEEGPLGEDEAGRRLDAWWAAEGGADSTAG